MAHTAAAPPVPVAEKIRRHGGGGPRRIAESAGMVITHGTGPTLHDDRGNAYLDFATAMGVAAIGHAHPIWSRAVAAQAGRLAACVLHLPEQASYLERLAAYLPDGLDRTALYSGGAEAVEVAVRLAQSVTGNRNLLSFTTGFHGKTIGVRFTGDRFAAERDHLGVGWVHHVPYPVCNEHDPLTWDRCQGDGVAELGQLEALADRLDGGIAAVILEPILGTAGNLPPERHFPAALRELCTRRGWLMILDESITGFGRLGTPFAAQRFGITPDILVLGKAMGGGFPLSGVAAGGGLWDQSLFAELSATSSSYGMNPLACVAGEAVLDIVEEVGFNERVTAVGRRLAEGIVALSERSPYVVRPRGVGMMLGFDLVEPATGELAGSDLCRILFRRCLEAGILIIGDVPRVRLSPPLVLSLEEADAAVMALTRALCR